MTPSQKKHFRGLLRQEMITTEEYQQLLKGDVWTTSGMLFDSPRGAISRNGSGLYKGRAIDVLKAKLLGLE